MEVFVLLNYKHALLPIWQPSYFVLFKIPVFIKYCIYNVNLKESLQWQLKWSCICNFPFPHPGLCLALKLQNLELSQLPALWSHVGHVKSHCSVAIGVPTWMFPFNFLFSLKEHLVLSPENVTSVPVLNPSPVSVLIIKTDGAVEVLLQLLLYFLAFKYDHDWAHQQRYLGSLT